MRVIRAVARFRPTAERVVLPDVACDVLWVEGRLLLTGPHQRGRQSAHVGKDVVLLKLEPSTARDVLGLPISELTDRVIPLADVRPRLAALLVEHMERRTVRTLVGGWVEPEDRRFMTASRALSSGMKVRAAAQLVDLGERQLERLFADRAGLSPVTYAQIRRLRRGVTASRALPLAQAAAVSGYADQSHFSRDARHLTGRSPRALIPRVGSVQDIVLGSF